MLMVYSREISQTFLQKDYIILEHPGYRTVVMHVEIPLTLLAGTIS